MSSDTPCTKSRDALYLRDSSLERSHIKLNEEIVLERVLSSFKTAASNALRGVTAASKEKNNVANILSKIPVANTFALGEIKEGDQGNKKLQEQHKQKVKDILEKCTKEVVFYTQSLRDICDSNSMTARQFWEKVKPVLIRVGQAVLGGVVAALAGFLFFQFPIVAIVLTGIGGAVLVWFIITKIIDYHCPSKKLTEITT